MTKFFEALNKSTEGLNGVVLPFSNDELNKAASSVAEKHIEPPRSNGHYSPRKEDCRTVSIRIPKGAPVLPFDGTHSLASERYRIIRTRIVQHTAAPRVICVSSTSAGDGKTVNALNIASSLALKRDTSVVLVDVDLRRPQLAALLGLPESPGLADLLMGNCTVKEVLIQIAEIPSLYFLPAGRSLRNPAELLDSRRWPALIESLKKEFDFVIADCPPMGVVADYDLIHPVVDGIVLVARPNHSNRKVLYKGIDQTPKEKFIGIVLNCVEDWFLWRTPDTSYYRYSHEKPGDA